MFPEKNKHDDPLFSFLKMIVHILAYSLSKSGTFFNFENFLMEVFLINKHFRNDEKILKNNICYKVHNKPIFHCNAKPFVLGTGVGLEPQHHNFALPIPTCWYLKMQQICITPNAESSAMTIKSSSMTTLLDRRQRVLGDVWELLMPDDL